MLKHFYHALDTPEGRQIYAEHKAYLARVEFPAEADISWVLPGEGFEQVTLFKVLDWCRAQSENVPVFYAHTKGATNQTIHATWWRRGMTQVLAGNWWHCIGLLDEYDAVGMHWDQEGRFFAGNFWWANSYYLASLNPPSLETRWHAEAWLGKGSPKVHDLSPGPPEQEKWGVYWNQRSKRFVQDWEQA